MDMIPYQFWNWKRNNGDGITADILRNVFDVQPVYADQGQTHLMGIGSIFALTNKDSHVWGSGVLDPKSELPPIPRSQIHAIRGTNTRKWLIQQGMDGIDLPMGDPGIFIDEVVAKQRLDRTPRHTIALIPHHDEIGEEWVQKLRRRQDICIVNMMDNTLRPVEQILQAEIVISQSLHGLIFAESLGKPNLWISTSHEGLWCWKFEDWFSTCREPQVKPASVTDTVTQWISQARLHDSTIDRSALKAAFPMDRLAQSARSIVAYEACRAIDAVTLTLPKALFSEAKRSVEFTEQQIGGLQWRIGEIGKATFSSWAEPAYLCLHDGQAPLSQSVVNEATKLLDQNGKAQFALLHPSESSTSGKLEYRDSTSVPETERIISGALLLRPCRWFSPRARHLIISY